MSTAQCLPHDRTLPARELHALATEAIGKLRTMRDAAPNSVQQRIERLCDAFCDDDPATAETMIREMRREGVCTDDIVGHILPRAARVLGERWEHDHASFADVTIGVGRMQLALRKLSAEYSEPVYGGGGATILMIAPRGEDHTFGLLVASDALRRRGGDVELSVHEEPEALKKRLRFQNIAAVGIGAAQAQSLEIVREVIDIVRQSDRRHVPVVLGGAVAKTEADLKRRTGADVVQADPILGFMDLGLLRPKPLGAHVRS